MTGATGDGGRLRTKRAAMVALTCAVGLCLVVSAGVMSAVSASGAVVIVSADGAVDETYCAFVDSLN